MQCVRPLAFGLCLGMPTTSPIRGTPHGCRPTRGSPKQPRHRLRQPRAVGGLSSKQEDTTYRKILIPPLKCFENGTAGNLGFPCGVGLLPTITSLTTRGCWTAPRCLTLSFAQRREILRGLVDFAAGRSAARDTVSNVGEPRMNLSTVTVVLLRACPMMTWSTTLEDEVRHNGCGRSGIGFLGLVRGRLGVALSLARAGNLGAASVGAL